MRCGPAERNLRARHQSDSRRRRNRGSRGTGHRRVAITRKINRDPFTHKERTMADQRPMTSPSTDRAAVTVDSMLSHFKGNGLLKIALFTIFAHIVILGGSSVPFLMKMVL